MKRIYWIVGIIITLLVITNPTNVKRHEEAAIQSYFKSNHITNMDTQVQIRSWVKGIYSVDNYFLFSIGVKTEPTGNFNDTFGIAGMVFKL